MTILNYGHIFQVNENMDICTMHYKIVTIDIIGHRTENAEHVLLSSNGTYAPASSCTDCRLSVAARPDGVW